MRATQTTTHLKLPRVRLDLPPAASLTIVTFCVICIVALVGRIQSAPAVVLQPTPSLPVIIIATAQPVAVPVAAQPAQQVAVAPAGNVTRRAVVAYSAPDLASAIGAVEPGRRFTPVAHFGADWMVVDMDGSGRVYIRVAELYDLPANLVDLKPAPAPQIVVQPVYVAAPAVEQPYQVSNEPAAPQQPARPPEQPQQPAQQPAVAPIPAPAPAAAPAADHPMPPSPPDDVTRQLMQEAWRQEHCIAGVCH